MSGCICVQNVFIGREELLYVFREVGVFSYEVGDS